MLALEPDTNLPVGHCPNTPQFALIVVPTNPERSRMVITRTVSMRVGRTVCEYLQVRRRCIFATAFGLMVWGW